MFEALTQQLLEKYKIDPEQLKLQAQQAFATIKSFDATLRRLESKLDIILAEGGNDVEKINADYNGSSPQLISKDTGHA